MENLESKKLSNFAKIIILLLIALFIGCIAFNIQAIKEGSILNHDEIVFNTYTSKNGVHEVFINDENSLTIENNRSNSLQDYEYTYLQGIIQFKLPDGEINRIIFLNTNRIYYIEKNIILYITD